MTASHTPTRRALQALELMQAEPAKLWNAEELSLRLKCNPNAVAPTLQHCINHGLIGKTPEVHGWRWYGLPDAVKAAAVNGVPVTTKQQTERINVMRSPVLTYTPAPSLRPGSMDAYALPSRVGDARIERTRPPMVLGSSVPQVVRK